MSTRKHILGIDGLRGLSALMVVLFHLKVRGFALGWAGVQFFFVISGYLITKILIHSREMYRDNIFKYLKVFYMKRTLRIFPLYYLYLIIAIAVAIIVHRPIGDAWQFFLYIQNYTLGLNHFNTQLVLGHTWSLAVEEQFYLLWPLLVWVTSSRHLFKLSIGLIITSILSRLLILHFTQNPFLDFSTLFSNFDTLALGTLLAIYDDHQVFVRLRIPAFLISTLLLLISIYSIGYSKLWTPVQWTFTGFGPFFLSILGFFFFTLLMVILHAPQWLLSWIDKPPIAFIGKISYGIYIYHSMVIIVVNKAVTWALYPANGPIANVIVSFVSITLTIFLSWLSYRYFEQKFLRLKRET